MLTVAKLHVIIVKILTSNAHRPQTFSNNNTCLYQIVIEFLTYEIKHNLHILKQIYSTFRECIVYKKHYYNYIYIQTKIIINYKKIYSNR